MAVGVRERLGADIGVAVTGIAGPGGGTPEKPVGLAYLALSSDDTLVARDYKLWGNREWIKTLVAQLVLDWVRRSLLGINIAEASFSEVSEKLRIKNEEWEDRARVPVKRRLHSLELYSNS